jgi:hypothetical protein
MRAFDQPFPSRIFVASALCMGAFAIGHTNTRLQASLAGSVETHQMSQWSFAGSNDRDDRAATAKIPTRLQQARFPASRAGNQWQTRLRGRMTQTIASAPVQRKSVPLIHIL